MNELGHVPDPLARLALEPLRVLTEHADRPLGRRECAREHPDRGRLAGAGWTDDAEDGAGRHDEADVLDRGRITEPLGRVIHDDGRVRGGGARDRCRCRGRRGRRGWVLGRGHTWAARLGLGVHGSVSSGGLGVPAASGRPGRRAARVSGAGRIGGTATGWVRLAATSRTRYASRVPRSRPGIRPAPVWHASGMREGRRGHGAGRPADGIVRE